MKVSEIAKNYLLGKTCDNCNYRTASGELWCARDDYKWQPCLKEKTCKEWQPKTNEIKWRLKSGQNK